MTTTIALIIGGVVIGAAAILYFVRKKPADVQAAADALAEEANKLKKK